MYPHSPGYKKQGTSKEAAEQIDARTLRIKALHVLDKSNGMTADEIASKLGLSILSIRPRITELKRLGMIEESGLRRRNVSGKNAIVWVRQQEEGQIALFSVKKQY